MYSLMERPCLVEGYFAKDEISLRNQVLARYTGFFQSLLNSPSEEVRLLVNLVARDPSSTTADNISYIRELTKFSPWHFSAGRIKAALPRLEVPEKEQWRIGLLHSLISLRNENHMDILDKKRTTAIIDSLCSALVLFLHLLGELNTPTILGGHYNWTIVS